MQIPKPQLPTPKVRFVGHRCRFAVLLGSWLLGVGSLQAQEIPAVYSKDAEGAITIRAIRLSEPIKLDGALDEAVYRDNVPATEFIQQEPNEGQPSTERTEAWVMFDEDNLYVAARCLDSHPERMVVSEMRRDSQTIFNNENLTIGLDTFHDRRSGWFFQTNPLGAIRDQEVPSERENNNDWNTVWDARARRAPDGWTVEVVIPFRSLRYKQAGPQTWGINLRRTIRWKNEQAFLSPVPASYGVRGMYKFSSAATLVGLDAPPQARNLEIKPYAISSLTTNLAAARPFSDDLGGDAGFDVKYGLTRGLTLDFTYDTDFAQVEDDEQQVNLTRFSLFFPEKREFFLEGQGIFAFASQQGSGGGTGGVGAATNLTPALFFSRRIGLAAGQEIPIRAGARVTGRAGKYAIGLMNIQTGENDLVSEAPANFSVVRIRRDILSRSTVGVIATRRHPSAFGSSNEAFGVDANFALFQDLFARGYYARTTRGTEAPPDGDALRHTPDSYRGEIDYMGDRYGLRVEHLFVGRDFNPEVGFLRRAAFRRNAAVALQPASGDALLARTQVHLRGGLRLHHDAGRRAREPRAAGDVQDRAAEQRRGDRRVHPQLRVDRGRVPDLGRADRPGQLPLPGPEGHLPAREPAPRVGDVHAGARQLLGRAQDRDRLPRAARFLVPLLHGAGHHAQRPRSAARRSDDEAGEHEGDLQLLAARVHERARAVQLQRELAQRQLPLPLGIPSGQRPVRGLLRRPRHDRARVPGADEPDVRYQGDEAVSVLV